MTSKQSLFPAREIPRSLREFADALDTDRGHRKSYVTLVMRDAAVEIERLRESLKTARGMASGLFPMVDRATWQGAGGDDGQGHYEGEYWAEQMEQEIASWKAEDV